MGNSLAIHIPRTWMWSHSLKNLEVSTFEIHGKLILAQWDRESMVEICQIPAEELNYEILTAFGVINNNSYQGGRLGGHAHISSMPPVSERAVCLRRPSWTYCDSNVDELTCVSSQCQCLLNNKNFKRHSRCDGSRHGNGLNNGHCRLLEDRSEHPL
jgi:hypothetical protein